MGDMGKLQCKALRKMSPSPGKLDMNVVASARSCMACGGRTLKSDILFYQISLSPCSLLFHTDLFIQTFHTYNMTAERVLLELASDDVPEINSGRFNRRPVEGAAIQPKTNGNQIPVPTPAPSPAAAIPLAFPESLGAPTLTSEAFPLNRLENTTFMGPGMNMIWRPRSSTKPSKQSQEMLLLLMGRKMSCSST